MRCMCRASSSPRFSLRSCRRACLMKATAARAGPHTCSASRSVFQHIHITYAYICIHARCRCVYTCTTHKGVRMRERKRLSASVGTCERVHKDSSGGIYVHGSMQFVCVYTYIQVYRYAFRCMRDGTYQNVGRIVECHVVGERPRAAGKHGNECRGCEEGMFHVRRHSFVRFVSRVARLSLSLSLSHTHTHTHSWYVAATTPRLCYQSVDRDEKKKAR